MEENEPNEPVEAPPAKAPAEGGRIADGDFLEHPALGCLAAVVLSFFVFLTIAIPSGSPGGWVIAFNVAGPVSGSLLWWLFRRSRPLFARGSLVFGIVTFVVLGTCWIVYPPSPDNWH